MATVLERVPLERIEAEADQVQFGRTVVAVLLGLLFAVGWLVGRAWRCLVWAAVAVKIGFQAGRSKPAAPPDGGS